MGPSFPILCIMSDGDIYARVWNWMRCSRSENSPPFSPTAFRIDDRFAVSCNCWILRGLDREYKDRMSI